MNQKKKEERNEKYANFLRHKEKQILKMRPNVVYSGIWVGTTSHLKINSSLIDFFVITKYLPQIREI